MKRMKLVGGKSSPRRISIASEKYVAEAKCDRSGNISCITRTLPAWATAVLRIRFIPRLIWMITFPVVMMRPRGRLIFALYGAGVIMLNTQVRVPDAKPIDSGYVLYILFFITLAVAAAIFFIKRNVATWHGAEHMAIAAYERNGLTGITNIAKESPVNPKCGGRLALPLIVLYAMSALISRQLEVNSLWVFLILFEGALWVDTLKGFDKITPFSQASTLLQRYVTTGQPNEKELVTAQTALLAVLTAHQAEICATTAVPVELKTTI